MKHLLFLFLVLITSLSLSAQSADSAIASEADKTEAPEATSEKVHNEIIKVNLFPMIGGRLVLNYELGLSSKLNRSSLVFGVESFGTFPVTQFEMNQPKGYAASMAFRKYISHPGSQVLDGSFVQLSSSLGFVNFVEERSVLIAPGKYMAVEERMNNPHATVFIGLGKQFVLYKRFALEYMFGLGAYITSNDKEKEAFYSISPQNTPTVFGFWNYEDTPLALTCGIKMGYV
ncbi:MAG: hypothetical protein ACKOXF_03660, partial [Chitinophagaceae bacterium]